MTNQQLLNAVRRNNTQNKSVCVIGAGAAGLCANKNFVDHGLNMCAFELTKNIGGTWVYRDDVGKDKVGNDVHSSMFKGFVTNTPKKIMGYPNLPFPDQENSYVTPDDVLIITISMQQNFIQFQHNVLRVRPLANQSWEVIVMDLSSNKCKKLHFNAVMVCNGHNRIPDIPKFKGQETLRGK